MDKDVKTEILNYMINPLQYAILLSGDWGCGKTYFVKNELQDIETYYVSLNGISSLSSLSFQIAYQLLGNKIFTSKKQKKERLSKGNIIASGVGNILISNLEKRIDVSFSDIIKLLGTIDFERKLLIFDDLERCSIDTKEILGFINNLVEHNNFKVLIIANETEISSLEYNKIKEKLIYQTIKYVPDLEMIYDKLLTTKDKEMQNNKFFLINELKRKEHFNIRTIQFIFQRYKELKSVLKQSLDDISSTIEINEKIYDDIFKYTVVVTRDYKMGETLCPFTDDCQLSYYQLIANSYFTIPSFKFVNDFIQGYGINKDIVKRVLSKYVKEIKSNTNNENNSLGIISKWWESEDEQIDKYTNQILNELKDNIYEYDLYPKILIYLIQITNAGFNYKYLKKGLSFMKSNINQSDSFVSLGYRIIDIGNENVKKYNELKQELLDTVDKHNNNLNKSSVDMVKNKEVGELGRYIYDWSTEYKTKTPTNKKIMQEIGVDNIIFVIESGNVYDVRFIVYLLNEIYNYVNVKELYSDDLVLLEELQEKISALNINKFSKMKLHALKSVKSTLQQIIEHLK